MSTKQKCFNRLKILLIVSSVLFVLLYFNFINLPSIQLRGAPLSKNASLNPLGSRPTVSNLTVNKQYCKDGTLVELFLTCDRANYTISANFSEVDDQFISGMERVKDYNNGTYRINYSISFVNGRLDGQYRIHLNTTNITSGFSVLNETSITLDNTIPNIYVSSPINGAFLRTNNITFEGFMNATGSRISFVQINDSRFDFLDNPIGNESGAFLILNKSAINEGQVAIRVTLHDSVELSNFTAINFIFDNTKPKVNVNILLNISNYVWFSVYFNGTYSPLKDFEYNISNLTLLGDAPVGKIQGSCILTNSGGNILADGKYTLNITSIDSVNLSTSVFCPFMIDTKPPYYDAIIQNISEPEYYQNVNLSLVNPRDSVSGISKIILNYSVDNQISWTPIEITNNNWAVLPLFSYNTTVYYYFRLIDKRYLIDKKDNVNNSAIYKFTIVDKIVPTLGKILQQPISPNQEDSVNISIQNAFDAGAGIAYLLLNYSIDAGVTWNLVDITANQYGVIERQPQNSRVLYQIIVVDGAGNQNISSIMEYIVYFKFDYLQFIIYVIVFGAVVAVSAYSGHKFYWRWRQKKLWSEFLTKRENLKTYLDLRMSDVDLILKDTSAIELHMNELLKFKWISGGTIQKAENSHGMNTLKEYIGITQISSEINSIKGDWTQKKREFTDKFRILGQDMQISKHEPQFIAKLDEAETALANLTKVLSQKYPFYIDQLEASLKLEFQLEAFEEKLAKFINKFQLNFNEFAKEFDQLLISRKNALIENRIRELESIFNDPDEWLKNAEQWSKILPLPRDRGYNHLLKLKKEQYLSLKSEFNIRIEKFRAELSSSIAFAQDFVKWNYDTLVNKLKKFEKVIYEDVVRFISSEEIESSNIDNFIEEKITSFSNEIENDKQKVIEFYKAHKEFHLEEIYIEWTAFVEEIPSNLKRIKKELNRYIQPLYHLFKLIKGATTNFSSSSMRAIEKISKMGAIGTESDQRYAPLDILLTKTVWMINRIDNEIKNWIDLLPFDLETSQLIILLRGWSEVKEEILEKINEIDKEKQIYKCEIMHEILNPLNDEIWECSNCGAIACLEHLEKWYHKKQAPECFKCGKAGTFKLKTFAE